MTLGGRRPPAKGEDPILGCRWLAFLWVQDSSAGPTLSLSLTKEKTPMRMWGDGPFESDGGLDEVFALLCHLTGRLEQVACGTGGDRSSITHDQQELAANAELLRLVAEAAYRPAMFAPIRGMPLPAPKVLAGWRDEFLARYARLAPEQVEGTPAEREQFGLAAAAPLARLADLSRRQSEAIEATQREVWAEALAARQREATAGDEAGV